MRREYLLIISGVCLAIPCFGGWILDGHPAVPDAAPAGGGTVAVEAGTYPVLRLELGGPWTDFELKASTNNFANNAEDVYYIRSWSPTACPDDTNVYIYFSDDGQSNNPTRWNRAQYGTAIFSQLVDPEHTEVSYVMVYPSHECVSNYLAWMSATNTALVWSFVRYDGFGYETNAAGRMHHNPTVPVEWRCDRPSASFGGP